MFLFSNFFLYIYSLSENKTFLKQKNTKRSTGITVRFASTGVRTNHQMNSTHIHHHLWPYALRGSVTLIVENTTIENFEQTIYRTLRQSIAKIIRKFCSTYQHTCLSRDTDAIRYSCESHFLFHLKCILYFEF